LINSNDLESFISIFQHPIINAFYHVICLGGNPHDIHGMTPGEPLYVLELGLFKIRIKGQSWIQANIQILPEDTTRVGCLG
jgi:hypothetical protein